MGFGFDVGGCQTCCCDKMCKPCACFTFYDPNTGSITQPDNIIYNVGMIYQCPAAATGDNITSFAGFGVGYGITVSGYMPGDITCQPTGLYKGLVGPSCFPFGGPECSGYNQMGCGNIPCYGDPSQSNGHADIGIMGYNDDMADAVAGGQCVSSVCVCSLDICNSGAGSCIPVPFCATKVNVTWDSHFATMLGVNPELTLATGICNLDPFQYVPYNACYSDGDNNNCAVDYFLGETSPGNCSYNLIPSVIWNSDYNRYTLDADPFVDIDVYVSYPGSYYIYNQGWNADVVTLDCLYQKINLCTDNNIQLKFTDQGTGGWTSSKLCPYNCNCGSLTGIPAKYPTNSLSLDFSHGVVFYIGDDWGNLVDQEMITMAANFTMPLDFNIGPPPGFASCQDNVVCYLNQCIGVNIRIPVQVRQTTIGLGDGYAGVGHVTLNGSYTGGLPGQQDVVCIQSLDDQVCGDLCTNTYGSITFSPWDCATLQANGDGSRKACFDSNKNFTHWADNDPCCGCDCNTNLCVYYYGYASPYNDPFTGYGTIDLCNEVIMIVLYDSQCNAIGTLTL